jgi:septum formation protein
MNLTSLPEKLILASSSKYRRQLLKKLALPFECISPDIDERRRPDESPHQLVCRLAGEKALHVARHNRDAVVIGSDQVAVFGEEVIGKPGTHARAAEQLNRFSGQTVEFLTAVFVCRLSSGFDAIHVDHTRVKFRNLQSAEIERYLHKETPYDCAGAFKAESLGIVLFRRIESEDPTALTGLPLIQTSFMLRQAGFMLP